MAGSDDFIVLYAPTAPVDPIRLGQLFVDETAVALKICTSLSPVTYTLVGNGLLSSNNTWTGTQEFDNDVNFDDVVDFDAAVTVSADMTFDTSGGDLHFLDNVKAFWGTGDDLSVYHDGTNSIINNATGSINLTGSNVVLLSDSLELRFGAGGDDLAIYHDGTDNHIDGNNGTLLVRNTATDATLALQTYDGTAQRNRVFLSSTATQLRDASGTTRLAIANDGAWTVGGTEGTSGQVLTSAGDSAPPTWETPATGGYFAYQDNNLVITSNAVLQDTDLVVALPAGTYFVEIETVRTSHATPDMDIVLDYTGTTTTALGNQARIRASTTTSVGTFTALPFTVTETTTDTQWSKMTMHFVASTSGDLKVQVRQVTSSATSVTFHAGSFMRVTPA